MSDLLRKFLYPLVVPCLVTAVWGYAWTRKYDDLMNAGGPVITFPASETSASDECEEPRYELKFVNFGSPDGESHAVVMSDHDEEE